VASPISHCQDQTVSQENCRVGRARSIPRKPQSNPDETSTVSGQKGSSEIGALPESEIEAAALEKGVGLALEADGSRRPVPAIDLGLVGQDHDLLLDAVDYLIVVPAGEIRPAYAEVEQRVTAEDDAQPGETDAAGAVTRRMQNSEMQVTDIQLVPILQHPVHLGNAA
jgi:hypothetical protein